MEAAVKALKMGKSAGVDNIPAKLVQVGGEDMTDILTSICNKIWKTGEWQTTWTQSLIITLPKKGNLKLSQNYRTISLISYPNKVMFKIILNRRQPKAEEIIAEEQSGFRTGSSTKKTFDRIWHEAYLAIMRKYNTNASIIRAFENLYDKAKSAVLFNCSTGEWFRTTVGVLQGCLFSPTP